MSQLRSATIVISRDGRGVAGDHAAFEDAVADTLSRECGSRVLVVPHLYYLRPSHTAATAMMSAHGDLVVASWLQSRAAFWTLSALGVGARAIRCLNLADFSSAEDCAQALAPGKSAGEHPAAVKEIADAASPRWYPVIDYSRCGACRKCVDFCLFGVYAVADGKVVVSNPDNCKNGCPACARTCPQRAIIFPHYFADAAIAGAETPARSEPSRPKPESDTRTEDAPPRLAPGKPDDLDHLITALEKLDE